MEGEYRSGKILILQKLEMVTNAPFLDEIYHSGNSDGNGEWMRGDTGTRDTEYLFIQDSSKILN